MTLTADTVTTMHLNHSSGGDTMKNMLLLAAFAVVSMILPSTAMKIETHCEKGEPITMESGTFEEDYLYLGPELNFSGNAQDLIFLGRQLSFSGTTEQGLIGIGSKIRYTGKTGNDLIAAGGSVVIDGKVNGNCFTAGKSVLFSDSSQVNGTRFIGCANGEINSPVNGDLFIGAGKMIINSTVDGSVKMYGGRLLFGENGRINGDLTYGLKEELTDDETSRISGAITRDEDFRFDMNAMFPEKSKKTVELLFAVFMAVSFVIIGCLLLFLPVFKHLDEFLAERVYWRTGLWGLIPMLMYPALILLSFLLIVTIPLGIILILLCIPLFFIAYIIGTTMTGKFIAIRFKWNIERRHYLFLTGAPAILIISVIPYINFLLFLFISSLGFGRMMFSLFNKNIAGRSEAIPQPLNGE